jgi:hypothetical protein
MLASKVLKDARDSGHDRISRPPCHRASNTCTATTDAKLSPNLTVNGVVSGVQCPLLPYCSHAASCPSPSRSAASLLPRHCLFFPSLFQICRSAVHPLLSPPRSFSLTHPGQRSDGGQSGSWARTRPLARSRGVPRTAGPAASCR